MAARTNGIEAAKANELFDLIDKFAGYGFNKSHAAAYALLAYQTAWMKTHYPDEFYAASMCFDMHQSDKLAIFVDDMRRMGVAMPAARRSTPARRSSSSSRPARRGLAVRYALGALNVGEKAMEQLVAEREARGPFRDLDDFAGRIDRGCSTAARSRASPAAAPSTSIAERAAVFAAAETILAAAASAADARDSGQGGLFGEGAANVVPIRMPGSESWSLAERMAAEKESFGFYFSAHPVDNYRHLVEPRARAASPSLPPCRRRPKAAAAARRWRPSSRTCAGAPRPRGGAT